MDNENLNEQKGAKTTKSGRGTSKKVEPNFLGKVPPQARSLEEAVLGALMLDKDAVSIVIDILRPDSFYEDRHQHIYKAICTLFEQSNPVDLLTVTEELKKMGVLDSIGGPFYLVELTNRVASAANVEYHARIVAQKYIQRELIRVSTDTINEAFEDTTDVFDLLDKAEQGLFSITERNLSRGFMGMSTLVNMALKQIEELSKKADGLTGVPSGFTALDRLTSGWQPSDLIIMAARPGMGKTSLTLAITCNAAIQFGKPVAFFSLEMSSVQLVNRIIAMETQISSEKLRKGQLEEYEWLQLHTQVARLSNVPIFIDDTPGISVFELRAKCRRLKMQHDIQMIIIDYLQLMTAGGDNKGNREQEISTISRSLKGLAKELSVPVIALSQLSRAVEVRGGSKRPQLSDLRECVTGDTRVLLQDGTLAKIQDLVGSVPSVWALNNNNHLLQAGETDLVWKVGQKPIFKITLASGRTIRATAEHRLLGINGWNTISSLQPNDRLAILRTLPQPENPVWVQPEKLIVLAHLIGDGSYLSGQPLRYTTATESHSQIVQTSAELAFGVTVSRHEGTGNWHQLVFSGNGNRWHKKGINAWLNEIGIWGQRSHQKQLPTIVFRLDNEQLALFMRHLWATDGTMFVPNTNKSSSRIAFSTNSRTLAEDVATLLLRFDIVARIRTIPQGEQYRVMYSVEVSGSKDQLQFLHTVGAFGAKEASAVALREYLHDKKSNTKVDTLPNEVFDYVKSAMQTKGISQRQMAALRETSYGGSAHFNFAPSREVVREYAQLLEDEQLEMLANTDIFWDKIISIEPDGEEDVYDLTVLEHHNWVANGIISHNSGAIEQDADIVGFIYRPEYYGILEDEDGNSVKGIGEVIIAKHRNGALDTVRLKWDGQFAKFSNLDDDAFSDMGDGGYFEIGMMGGDDDSGQIISSKINGDAPPTQQPPNSLNYSDDVPF